MKGARRFSWLSTILIGMLAVACDRGVNIRGEIVSESAGEIGDCTAKLFAHEIDGIHRQWIIPHVFDQAVLVDPIRRPTYYLTIQCQGCPDVYRSPDFVEGELDLGIIRLANCSKNGS